MKYRFLGIFGAGVTANLALFIGGQAQAQDPTPTPSEAITTESKPAEKPLDIVGYDKGFFIQSPDGKFKMTMGGYIQGLFANDFIEGGDNQTTVRVRRARLKWFGHLFSKNFQYELEYDFPGNKLLTAELAIQANEGFRYKIGQFYVPYNFEGYISSSNQQFVDRSILQAAFGIADEREPGMGLNGSFMGKKLEYDVGVFNGEGLNNLNRNNDYRYAGRFTYNAMGYHGREFADVKDSEAPNVTFGVGGMYNDTLYPNAPAVATGEQKIYSLTADAEAKYKGLGIHAAYLYQHVGPEGLPSGQDHGVLGQVGYFLIPKHLELAGRVAMLFAETTKDLGEYTFGINYYIHGGHGVKFQTNYSLLTVENGVAVGDDALNHRIAMQLQFKI